jgi:peptide/nickel transport system substrate-binding protein
LDPASKDRPLEVLVAQDAETLDPRFAVDATAARTTRLMHAGLFKLDETDLHPIPNLAREAVFEDPKTLHISLRDDVRFHGGKPLVADDVVATIRAIGDPAKSYRQRHVVAAIGAIEADGIHAVRIHLSRPRATLLSDLELPILRADEADAPARPDGSLDGLGPYELATREPGVTILRPAKHGISEAKPPVYSVALRAVRDENARALRLLAGRVDVAPQAFSPLLLPPLEAKFVGGHTVRTMGANLTYLVPRIDRGPLTSAPLRRGLALAIDRERMARTFFAGHAIPATSLLPPRLWAHDDGLAPDDSPFQFDILRAKAAFAEAGVDTTHRVALSFLVSTDRFRGTLGRFLAQELAPLGVDLHVEVLELGVLLDRLGRGDFDLALLQMPELTEPNALQVFLHSGFIPPLGSNRGRVRDAELDALLDEGDQTSGLTERKAIYSKVERRARALVPWIPLFHEEQVALVGPRASAFVPLADGRLNGLAKLE